MPVSGNAARQRLARLARALGNAKRILVITHDNPDPDALSSAWALRALFKAGTRRVVDVAYGGIIGRPENRAMATLVGYPLVPLDQIAFERYERLALVDSQPETGNNSIPADRVPDVVIDHHPLRDETRAVAYYDVRPTIGATATIVGEYLDAAKIRIERPLATALFLGIKSETLDFSREATARDIAFHRSLFDRVDRVLLSRIENAPLSRDYLEWLKTAITGTSLEGRLALARLGDLDYPDRVAEYADMAIRLEGVEWVVVMGRFEGAIYLSVRTTRARGAGQMVRRIVGAHGKAGGHGTMAGGKVPIPNGASAKQLESDLMARSRELLA
ncbi:MAG: DHH family phosphoesterase [bacterium]